ncbi:MAG: putative leader peptide [Streptosporangiaceae bacterium]
MTRSAGQPRLPSQYRLLLSSRRHVDFLRVSSAMCRSCR